MVGGKGSFHILPKPVEGGSRNRERQGSVHSLASPTHRVAFHCGKQSAGKMDLIAPS